MQQLTVEYAGYTYKNRYQTTHAVSDVQYTFLPGRFYAVVGRSGCGKTTLLSLLAGLDLPTAGCIRFDGQSLADIDRDAYRCSKVSVIYQSFNLLPLLTVLENVMYPLQLTKTKAAREIAVENLAKVGLDEGFYRRFPSMLSGGEQQRVAIARTIASQAEVILADEPTGNLDTANAETIVQILRRLAHENGYCVIVVTHDLGIAAVADEVIPMADGRIVPAEG